MSDRPFDAPFIAEAEHRWTRTHAIDMRPTPQEYGMTFRADKRFYSFMRLPFAVMKIAVASAGIENKYRHVP